MGMGNRRIEESHRPRAEGLIDIATVAERLGVKVRYVRRLVAERRIEYVKVGRLIRFDPAEVDAWIDRGRVSPFEPRPLQRGRRAS